MASSTFTPLSSKSGGKKHPHEKIGAVANRQEQVLLPPVELEVLLATKVEDGQPFDRAVRSAMVQSGNELMFFFPAGRFPLPCVEAACIRLHDDEPADDSYLYLYQREKGEKIEIAKTEILDLAMFEFAASFSQVMEQLRGLIGKRRLAGKTH